MGSAVLGVEPDFLGGDGGPDRPADQLLEGGFYLLEKWVLRWGRARIVEGGFGGKVESGGLTAGHLAISPHGWAVGDGGDLWPARLDGWARWREGWDHGLSSLLRLRL